MATGGVTVDLPPASGVFDPESGAQVTPTEDNGVDVDFSPFSMDKPTGDEFDANLAETLDDETLDKIASDLLEGIQTDDDSRQEWLQDRAEGIKLLGLKLESPRSDVSSSAPLEGMSVVRHPLLLEAVLRGQANAVGELLPASGPVKVRNDGKEDDAGMSQAERLEKDFNHYLTSVAKEYYPDTDRMLLMLFCGGSSFKKGYHCPIRRRPVLESIDAKDLIVSNAATDIFSASRVTHQISMRRSMLRRMQLVGAYREVDLGEPSPEPNIVDQQQAQQQGVEPSQRPEDSNYTIYECYCELDLDGKDTKAFTKEDEDDKGLHVPYKVVIEKDSQKVLEIRRHWEEGDDLFLAERVFVKYSFVPGLGFYDIGLANILGNSTAALTAAWRLALDNGMFSNFPGFLFSRQGMARQRTNEFRVAPGSGVPIDTGGMPIRDAVLPLPYKEVGGTFMQLMEEIATTSRNVGGIAEITVGEGKQDAPVGTTIALIEQATKIMSSVHKRLHQSQAEEFQILKKLFREDPEALIKNKKKNDAPWDEATLLAALENNDLVPAADPNIPSHTHRILKAQALMQIAMTVPGLFDTKIVATRVMKMMGFDDVDVLYNKQPPAPPQVDPNVAADLMLRNKQQNMQAQQKAEAQKTKLMGDMAKLESKKQDRESREKIERMHAEVAILDLISTFLSHPENHGSAEQAVQIGKSVLGV